MSGTSYQNRNHDPDSNVAADFATSAKTARDTASEAAPDAARHRIVFELHRLIFSSSALINSYTSRLGLHGKDGEAVLLVWQAELEDKPLTPSNLAMSLHITRAAASYQVERLVEQGLLQRHSDPADRRRTLLGLGKNAADVGHYFTTPLSESMGELFAGRRPREVQLFTEMLGELADALQTWHQGGSR